MKTPRKLEEGGDERRSDLEATTTVSQQFLIKYETALEMLKEAEAGILHLLEAETASDLFGRPRGIGRCR